MCLRLSWLNWVCMTSESHFLNELRYFGLIWDAVAWTTPNRLLSLLSFRPIFTYETFLFFVFWGSEQGFRLGFLTFVRADFVSKLGKLFLLFLKLLVFWDLCRKITNVFIFFNQLDVLTFTHSDSNQTNWITLEMQANESMILLMSQYDTYWPETF